MKKKNQFQLGGIYMYMWNSMCMYVCMKYVIEIKNKF